MPAAADRGRQSVPVILLRILLIVSGGAITAVEGFFALTSIVHFWLIFALCVGLLMLLYGLFFKSITRHAPKWLRICFFGALTAAAACCLALFLYGSRDNATYREDAVIVLGASVLSETPTAALVSRLDAAVRYSELNKSALIVVSGGQGDYEDIPESLAMKRYLVSRGVSPDRILMESESSNTAENLLFTKKLLDARLDPGYSIAVATNDYHILRACLAAGRAGFTSATHICGPTPWNAVLPDYFRECAALAKFLVFPAA